MTQRNELQKKYIYSTISVYLFYTILISFVIWWLQEEGILFDTPLILTWALIFLPFGTTLSLGFISYYFSQMDLVQKRFSLLLGITLVMNYFFDFSIFQIDDLSSVVPGLILFGMFSLLFMLMGWGIGRAIGEKLQTELVFKPEIMIDRGQIYEIPQEILRDFNGEAIFRKFVNIIRRDYSYGEIWSSDNSVMLAKQNSAETNRVFISYNNSIITVNTLTQNGKRLYLTTNEDMNSEINVIASLILKLQKSVLKEKQKTEVNKILVLDFNNCILPSSGIKTVREFLLPVSILLILFVIAMVIVIFSARIMNAAEENGPAVVIALITGFMGSLSAFLITWIYGRIKKNKSE